MNKVLLVVGNGFDLKLGLKTTFTNYIESNYYSAKINEINEFRKDIGAVVKNRNDIDFDYFFEFNGKLKYINELNFWDLYFGLKKVLSIKDDNKTWADIEKSIHDLLKDVIHGKDAANLINIIKCKNLESSIYGKNSELDYLIILFVYMAQKNFISDDKGVDYSLLLKDLKKFEKYYGTYINEENQKHNYYDESVNLINKLIGKDNELGGIDTFNYSIMPFKDKKVWYINGDYNHPIVGIDDSLVTNSNDASVFDEKWYEFTKTYRRLELYGDKKASPKNRNYSGIIVYGHSLNEQDYSYYYPLFNQLDFTNTNKSSNNGKYITFKYSAREGCTSEQAKEKTIVSVINMLARYNKEILNAHHFRLMDILFNQNRIRFEEVK